MESKYKSFIGYMICKLFFPVYRLSFNSHSSHNYRTQWGRLCLLYTLSAGWLYWELMDPFLGSPTRVAHSCFWWFVGGFKRGWGPEILALVHMVLSVGCFPHRMVTGFHEQSMLPVWEVIIFVFIIVF